MLLQEWVELGCNTQPDRECSCQPDRFVLVLEVEIELRRKMRMFAGELHLERIMDTCLTLFGEALRRGSFIENSVTDNDGIIQGSEVNGIRIEAFW
ncbi:hypothetical protein Tco_0093698 [Tanacetum coccineum]